MLALNTGFVHMYMSIAVESLIYDFILMMDLLRKTRLALKKGLLSCVSIKHTVTEPTNQDTI